MALLVLLLWTSAPASAQTLTISTASDTLKVRAPNVGFLKGEPLARLKDGRSVRVELTLTALPGQGKPAAATARKVFALSYDLWEERFAVTTVGARAQSASHLALAAAEAWCVDQLAIPLGAIERDAPFWVRLEYQVLEGETSADTTDPFYTLQALIDLLSRRGKKTESSPHALEAGPFRAPSRAASSRR